MNLDKLPNHEIPNTAYSFNCLFSPRFTSDINKQFSHVESAMTRGVSCDSHGRSYNLITSTFTEDDKGYMDRSLTRVFLETILARTKGYNKFLSWGTVPQVEFETKRVAGSDVKFYTLKTSFTCF